MALTLITSKTAPSDADSGALVFTNGSDSVVLDSTYKEYQFHFVNLHPANNAVAISFQVDTASNTSYNQAIASSFFRTKHHEDGSAQEIAYVASYDQKPADQAFQLLCNDLGNANDESVSGLFTLYDPSNGTHVKHFTSRMSEVHESDIMMDSFCAGYVDTGTALTTIKFKFDSGNIDTGTIYMYGVS